MPQILQETFLSDALSYTRAFCWWFTYGYRCLRNIISWSRIKSILYLEAKNRYAEDKAPQKRVLTAFSYLIMKNRCKYEKYTNVVKVAVQDAKQKTYSTWFWSDVANNCIAVTKHKCTDIYTRVWVPLFFNIDDYYFSGFFFNFKKLLTYL